MATKQLGVGLLAIVAALAAVRFGSATWCARDADAWFEGEQHEQLAMARTVARSLDGELDPARFETGSRRFDGEWLFGTYVMAALGLAQVSLEHPEHAHELRPQLARAIDGALSPAARDFDRDAWGADPIETLDGDAAHAAYLGYLGVALGLERALDRGAKHAALHDRIAAALARRLASAPGDLIETYPGEIYPVDNASVVATLALHARALGRDRPAVVERWLSACRERFVDPATGLLVQAMDADGRSRRDRPRASGTALGAYFLSFVDAELSDELGRALERSVGDTVLGFGVVREYPPGHAGLGDIDSGPLVFGYSISATGFSLASCRRRGDRECFRQRYATFHLFGAPLDRAGRFSFVSGGALGDAIVLAMLTAPRRP